MQKFLAILFLAILFSGCFYDKKAELYPVSGTTCDTLSTMSYANHIAPILSSYCYSCHSGSNPTAGVNLTTWSGVITYVNNGQLIGSIKHLTGYNQMPPSAPLDACRIRQIELWVQAGAPNN